MNTFIPKVYQREALASVEAYLRACNRMNDADTAFYQTTKELWGQGVHYRPIDGFDAGMPYFCLRVPTGGGKTFLAAKSVPLVNQHLLAIPHSVILWLVPSMAIRDQTLRQLKDRSSPLRAALAETGEVTVLDLQEAKSLSRATLETSTVVIVTTVQAFRREDTEGLKVYESNGALMPHFDGLSAEQSAVLLRDDSGVVPRSLANVLRLRRPFLIVDEAHNNRTELSFSTFANFRPSGVLELTATPDTEKTPSNVLHSVSAAELKAEQMIKLPIVLETQGDWQRCLAYALDTRNQLQAAAEAERKKGAAYLRPIVLIQAQARREGMDTLDVDRVRAELIANHSVPEPEIVVATGDERGLVTLDKAYAGGISSSDCPVKYVITQKALAEGWDCPFAYILVSLAEVRASTSVEQLLGRILRQPGAQARATASLNQSYAFVVSRDFTEAAQSLRDRLVEGAGFERRAVADFVTARTTQQRTLDWSHPRTQTQPVQVTLPEGIKLTGLPLAVKDKLEWDRKSQTLTLKAPLSENEAAALTLLAGDANRAILEQAIEAGRASVEFFATAAESGERLAVPQLAVRVQGTLQLFDDPEVLQYPFALTKYSAAPGNEELAAMGLADRISSGGIIDTDATGRLGVGFLPDLQRDLGFSYVPEHWDALKLTAWLCRNLPDAAITDAEKRVWVKSWLDTLLARNDCDLARANRQKFLIRNLLEARITALKRAAAKETYQQFLFGSDAAQRISVGGDYVFEFPLQGYAPTRDDDREYGVFDFRKHYYGRIGAFDSAEEFACACRLDQQAQRGRLKFWLRNLARKETCSFFLQKADGRFYPDFLAVLPDDRLLVVEYKGANLWAAAQDDREIGELWARMSGGRCLFVMVRDRNWAAIDDFLVMG